MGKEVEVKRWLWAGGFEIVRGVRVFVWSKGNKVRGIVGEI